MSEPARRRVLVIGGGLSGAAVAHALLARADGPLQVTIAGRSPLGEGAAYGSPHPMHLLNVRARAMSLVDGDDGHFVRWLAASGGQLRVEAGRLTSLELRADGVAATITLRHGGAPVRRTVERVINATGPSVDYQTWDDPLVRSLFDRGWIRPGPLGFGLDATTEGAILDRNGRISTTLATLGPTLRGALWETTAVPEIRARSARLATRILTDLETRRA
jgi:uncharacterized NAD(P)/FAD-binding protein YdhS